MSDWEADTRHVLGDVLNERRRQVARYGFNEDLYDGSGPDTCWLLPIVPHNAEETESLFRYDYEDFEAETGRPTWVHLIREEVAEAFKEDEAEKLETELLQVAALCVSWIEQLRKRGARPLPYNED
jgi:hypothetical protein